MENTHLIGYTTMDVVYVKVRKSLAKIASFIFWLFGTMPLAVIFMVASWVLSPLILICVIIDAKDWITFKRYLYEIYVEMPRDTIAWAS
jgi:hypothetical protein